VVERPCKVYHAPSGRYLAGETCDVSRGGALLRVASLRPLAPGDAVEVFIAWSGGVLLSASDRIHAVVTRVMQVADNQQVVAAEFLAVQQGVQARAA